MKAKYVRPEAESIALQLEAPILSGSDNPANVHDEMGNGIQLSQKGGWSADNWNEE